MHVILQGAQSVLCALLDSAVRQGAPIAPEIDVLSRIDLMSFRYRWTFDSYGVRRQFEVSHLQMMNLTSTQRGSLIDDFRAVWRDLVAEHMRTATVPLQPPAVSPGQIWESYYDTPYMRVRRQRIEPEELFGGAVTTSNVRQQDPQEERVSLFETMRQAMEAMPRISGLRREDLQARFRAIDEYMRARPSTFRPGCTCARCRDYGPEPPPPPAPTVAQREREYRSLAWARYSEPEQGHSLTLLREWLSPEQLAQYEADTTFIAIGSKTGRHYRISYGLQQNVVELDGQGQALRGWCFGPSGEAARWVGDVMLAQKLALETDEEGAMRVALRWGGPPTDEWRPRALYEGYLEGLRAMQMPF